VRNKKAYFGKRPVITDGPTKIIADIVESNDSLGTSILTGRAVYIDSSQGVSVLANRIDVNRTKNEFLATQHPLMILKQENDSIYITADTLYSGRLSALKQDSAAGGDTLKNVVSADTLLKKNDSADRYFKAWHHVRIFSDSLQAVSDSLIYSGEDSIFRLYTDPVAWANNSQVTGDTMFLYTKNKKPERMHVFENAMAINKSGTEMYNQIKGNRMVGYFNNGEIDYIRARGNAESIYYVLDEDSAVTGINKATSDIIDMRFKNKELDRVVFISAVEGTLFPYRQATEQDRYLRGFKWRENLRPKTKYELFEDPTPPPPADTKPEIKKSDIRSTKSGN
jgi:hypothetical protein